MSPPENVQPSFRDLTLWQVLRLLLYRPSDTLRLFFAEIALREPETAEPLERAENRFAPVIERVLPAPSETVPLPETAALTAPLAAEPAPETREIAFYRLLLGGLGAAVFLALIGGLVLWNAALDNANARGTGPKSAPFWFALAIANYTAVMLLASYRWWQERFNRASAASPSLMDGANAAPSSLEEGTDSASAEDQPSQAVPFPERFFKEVERHSIRLALVPVGIVLAYLAYTQNVTYDSTGQKVTDVVFTTNGGLAWLLGGLVWFGVLGLDLNALFYRLVQRLSGQGERLRWSWRPRWQHGVLLLILVLAGFFRLHNLSGVPPEMTSDHIEKLLDALRVYDGYHGIFFRNNGGREGFQMHFIALLVRLTGMEFSFNTLKLATIIEGMLTIGLAYPLGVVVIGRDTPENRRLGVWLGLALAGLLAISSWHVMLSRLGLRIVLTPLTTIVMLIFLLRAMRHNHRLDFVLLGGVLGIGAYFYQSNRMLPLVAAVGMLLAVAVYARSWREVGRYAVNFACTVILAVVIFLPMYRFEQAFPKDFWNRTRGRLFGEQAFVRENPQTGVLETYEPSLREQAERFFEKFDVFKQNYKDALLMWSWKGDGAWISNGQGRPALDPYTDGLLILGAAGILLLFLKRWDVGHLIIPIGALIMILPSALTLAYTIENPSFTRASGAIPFVFLMAAYPLAQLGYYASRSFRAPALGIGVGLVLMLPIIGLASRINYESYFTIYRESYARSWKPYEAFAKPLRDFAEGEGSWGNAFMIAYPHWLDHRGLAILAGDIHWNNGLVNRTDVFAFIQRNAGTRYAYDPTKPTFFMYNKADSETDAWLLENFPGGQRREIAVEGRPELNYYVYLAPPNIDWGAVQEKQQVR